MAARLPFHTWTRDECELVFDLLGDAVFLEPIARLLLPREFALIRLSDLWTRRFHFWAAKDFCRIKFSHFLVSGARDLHQMKMKYRARTCLFYKSRYEAFLLEIAYGLQLFAGEEVERCRLPLRLPLALGEKRKGLAAVFDRSVCWVLRGLLCPTKGSADALAVEEPRVWFDQHIQEEMEMMWGMDAGDLMKYGMRADLKRGWHIMKYMVGKGVPPPPR